MQKSFVAIAVASLISPIYVIQAKEITSQETMVVTANRFEQKQSEVLSSTTVITSDDISSHQDDSLIDTLRRVVGVEFAQNGGRGHHASTFIRGTNSDHTLVLMDGMRINSAGGGVDLNRFPIGLVERVEIIRGPSAVIYGSDAIGGVINIITRSHRGDNAKSLSIGIGSHNKSKSGAVIRDDYQDYGHIQFAAGSERTDGYDIKASDPDIDYGYEGQNIAAGYEHSFNEALVGYVAASWFENEVEYDAGASSPSHGYVANKMLSGQLTYRAQALNSTLSLSHQNTRNLDYTQSEGSDNASTKKDITLTQLQWTNLYQTSSWGVGAGIDARKESLGDNALNYGFAHALAGESRTTKGIFASANYQLEQAKFEVGIRHDKHDVYDEYTTWSVAAGYGIDAQHSMRVSYGTAFKAPNYTDLSSTPDLEAERSHNVELGFSGHYDNDINWNLSLYDNTVDNLIIWYNNGGSWTSSNVDARIKGVEFDVDFTTGPVQHTFSAEFKDHKDDNRVQLARRAKQNYKWMSSVTVGDFDLGLTYNYIGKRLDLPTEQPTADSYISATQLWDVNATYWIDDSFSIKGKIANLLDTDYETAIGYVADGRNYELSLNYQF